MKVPDFIVKMAEDGAGQGERNNKALLLAAQLRDARLPAGEQERLMAVFASRCAPPMSWDEAQEVLRKANSRAPREPPRMGGGPGGDEVIAWDGVIGPRLKQGAVSISPGYVEDVPPPGGSALSDLRAWLAALYQPDDFINYVCRSEQMPDGRVVPAGRGVHRTRKAIEADLQKYERKGGTPDEVIRAAIGDYTQAHGMWSRLNPTDGKGCNDANIVDYRHVLVESDHQEVGEQLAIIRSLGLPVAALTHSGGKSIHAVVRVDAGQDKALYNKRVDMIFAACEAAGLVVDKPNRNPSRLSRIAGPMRGDSRQYLIEAGDSTTWGEWEARQHEQRYHLRGLNINSLWDPPQVSDNLIGDRFLTTQGSWIVVAQSGVGKSSLLLQAAFQFALERPFFGLRPARRLKSLIIQAENNDGDMHEMVRGVFSGRGFDDQDRGTLRDMVIMEPCSRYVGGQFADFLEQCCRVYKPDIVWIDPLNSYIGGEVSRMQDASRFLRNQLQPVIEDYNIAVVIMHHTTKPPKSKEDGYQGHDLAYLGAGASDITNWARAISVLQREDDKGDTFIFSHIKRGRRAGVQETRIRHAQDGSICWHEATTEAPKLEGKRRAFKSTKYDGLGLEMMAPCCGIWSDEKRVDSEAARKVSEIMSNAGMGVSVEAAATLLRNRRLVDYLRYDKAQHKWRGKLWTNDFL